MNLYINVYGCTSIGTVKLTTWKQWMTKGKLLVATCILSLDTVKAAAPSSTSLSITCLTILMLPCKWVTGHEVSDRPKLNWNMLDLNVDSWCIPTDRANIKSMKHEDQRSPYQPVPLAAPHHPPLAIRGLANHVCEVQFHAHLVHSSILVRGEMWILMYVQGTGYTPLWGAQIWGLNILSRYPCRFWNCFI